MDDNPYRSPDAPIVAEVVGVLSGKREDLRLVVKYQRGLLFCVLIHILAIFFGWLIPPELRGVAGLVLFGAGVIGLVFVFLLSTKVYGTVAGLFLGLLTLVPCIGLIVLIIVNQKATTVLRQNGLKVGLLGADPNAV